MPTGRVGDRVVRELLAPEFSVRVLTRDPARLSAEVREQVDVVTGSTSDADSLETALKEVEAVFWCVPTEPLQVSDLRRHYERHGRAGCEALRKAGTPRVVLISAAGDGLVRSAGAITGLQVMETLLNESGAAFRHLRCGLLMEAFLSESDSILRHGLVSYPVAGDIPVPMVAACDVADVALRWLVRRDWENTDTVPVQGPVDLSFNQAAAILERVLRRPVRYQEASANYYLQSLVRSGASVEYARGRISMFAELARGVGRTDPEMAAYTTPTTLTEWAESELLPGACPPVQVTRTEAVTLAC